MLNGVASVASVAEEKRLDLSLKYYLLKKIILKGEEIWRRQKERSVERKNKNKKIRPRFISAISRIRKLREN